MIPGVIDFVRKVDPGLHDLYRKQDLYRTLYAPLMVVNLSEVMRAAAAHQSAGPVQ